MGVIRHSSNRKVDIEELKQLLATQLKAAKHGSEPLDSMPTRMSAATATRGTSGHNRSRSRSKGHTHATIPMSNLLAGGAQSDMRSSANTLKMANSFADDSAVPAWYKTLKKNIH